MTRGGLRYGIFVHDPDGDMGDGVIVGAFKTADIAEKKAEAIRKASPKREYDDDLDAIECVVLPLWPGSGAARNIAVHVIADP